MSTLHLTAHSVLRFGNDDLTLLRNSIHFVWLVPNWLFSFALRVPHFCHIFLASPSSDDLATLCSTMESRKNGTQFANRLREITAKPLFSTVPPLGRALFFRNIFNSLTKREFSKIDLTRVSSYFSHQMLSSSASGLVLRIISDPR